MPNLYQLELPYQADPCFYFAKCRHLKYPVMLDSCAQHTQGRYDIITANPHTIISTHGQITSLHNQDGEQQLTDDPLAIVQQQLHNGSPQSELPFIAGAIGYCAYELGQRFERLPHTVIDDIKAPDMFFAIYDWSIVTDHELKKTWLVSYRDILTSVRDLLDQPGKTAAPFKINNDLQSNISYAEYQQAFNCVMEHILCGDCYQTNLSQRFSTEYSGDPWDFYQRCRQLNPAPYSAFIDMGEDAILSFSPELFLSIHDRQVLTKPIKGTRPRSKDPVRDLELANDLLADEKERAENLMIVDLLRNDLGRTCRVGSIQVPKLFALESFPAVHHLVSSVTGELADSQTSIDCLRQCFPGGSITGAPKIRAMEIIDEVEKHQRSIYCGSIIAIDHNGNCQSNISIRTLLCEDNTIYCWAGGAIVADSTVDSEYQETLDKIKIIATTIRQSAQTYPPIKPSK